MQERILKIKINGKFCESEEDKCNYFLAEDRRCRLFHKFLDKDTENNLYLRCAACEYSLNQV
jgi:hypothetical protein